MSVVAVPLNTDEMFAAIDDQRASESLPALRSPGATRQHRDPLLARNRDRRGGMLAALRHDDTQRLDLVDRSIGRIASAAESIEQYLTADLAPQASFKTRCLTILERHVLFRNNLVSHQRRFPRQASMLSAARRRQTNGDTA